MSVSPRRAFTLIELLVVIALIAILAVVVVLTLNPAELLRQSRDSTRLSDLATVSDAVNLYNTDQGGSASYSLGSSSVTYLSISDPTATSSAGTNCSGLGGNIATGTAYFQCPANSTSRNVNGTGWIPINFTKMTAGSPFGSLPVDPTNSTSSNLYYSYQTNGSTYRIVALPESQKYLASLGQSPLMFTAGSNPTLDGGDWVLVPGNSTFGTNNFYVMKYAAVCTNGNGTVVNAPADGGGYDNNSTGCTPANNEQIAALPGGYPVVDISHTTAVSYCQSIGAHLMTNDEYMTIAMNATGQTSNWTGGVVGSGGLYLGNANNASEYPADPNDANGYSNGTGGTMSSQTITYTGDERRTLNLSDGSVIWDISGNVWEEVQRSDMNQGDNQNIMSIPNCSGSGWTWCNFSSATAWSAASTSLTASQVSPPNGYTSSQDIGELLTYSGGGSSQGTNGFIRGGLWGNGAVDGVFGLGLAWNTNSTGNYVGFRCAR